MGETSSTRTLLGAGIPRAGDIMTDHVPDSRASHRPDETTTPDLASLPSVTTSVAGTAQDRSGKPSTSGQSGRLGLIALVCAVVGTVFAAWEGAYIVGWVLLPIAFVLSIVAIAMRSRRRMAVAALVLSIVGTVVGVVAFAHSVDKVVTETFGSATVPPAGTTATQAGAEDADGASEAEPTFKDGTYSGGGLTITITGTRVIPVGQEGNQYGSKPILDIDYTIANVSATQEVNPAAFGLVFTATQDNDPNAVNELQVGIDETAYDKYGDTGTQAIKVGGSVDYTWTYELDDTTTPVELVASTLLGKEVGRQIIPLQ